MSLRFVARLAVLAVAAQGCTGPAVPADGADVRTDSIAVDERATDAQPEAANDVAQSEVFDAVDAVATSDAFDAFDADGGVRDGGVFDAPPDAAIDAALEASLATHLRVVGTDLVRNGRPVRFVGQAHVRNFPAPAFADPIVSHLSRGGGATRHHGVESGWDRALFGRVQFARGEGLTWQAPYDANLRYLVHAHHAAGHTQFVNVFMDNHNDNAIPGMQLVPEDVAYWGDRTVIGYLRPVSAWSAWFDMLYDAIAADRDSVIWEVSNEDSMFALFGGDPLRRLTGFRAHALPAISASAATRTAAQNSWNAYLRSQYVDDTRARVALGENLLSSADLIVNRFTSTASAPGESGWEFVPTTTTRRWVAGLGERVERLPGEVGTARFRTAPINFIGGMRYAVEFDIASAHPGAPSGILFAAWDNLGDTGSSNASIYEDHGAGIPAYLPFNPPAGTTLTHVRRYALFRNDATGRLTFHLAPGQAVYIANVSIRQIGTSSYPTGAESIARNTVVIPDESRDYIPKIALGYRWWTSVERTYLDAARAHIRGRDPIAPVIGSQSYGGFANALLSLDVADHHIYGPTHQIRGTESFTVNEGFARHVQTLETAFSLVDGKPNTISECAWSMENEFAPAFPIYYAILASAQGLPGFIVHAFGRPNQNVTWRIAATDMEPVQLAFDGNPIVQTMIEIAANVMRNGNIPPIRATTLVEVTEQDADLFWAMGSGNFPLFNATAPDIVSDGWFGIAAYQFATRRLVPALGRDPESPYLILRYNWRNRIGTTSRLVQSGTPDTRFTHDRGIFAWSDDRFCFAQIEDLAAQNSFTFRTPTQGTATVTFDPGQTGPANVVINAMDGRPLGSSPDIRVEVFGRVDNTGETYVRSTLGSVPTRRVSVRGDGTRVIISRPPHRFTTVGPSGAAWPLPPGA